MTKKANRAAHENEVLARMARDMNIPMNELLDRLLEELIEYEERIACEEAPAHEE